MTCYRGANKDRKNANVNLKLNKVYKYGPI